MGMNKRDLHYLKCREVKTTSSPVDIHHRGEAPSDIVHTLVISATKDTKRRNSGRNDHSRWPLGIRQSSIPIHSQSPAPEIEIPLGGFIIFSSLDWPALSSV